MSELTALEKAKAAMAAAKILVDGAVVDHAGNIPLCDDLEFSRLLRVADAHAAIALVEALERLVPLLEYHFGLRSSIGLIANGERS